MCNKHLNSSHKKMEKIGHSAHMGAKTAYNMFNWNCPPKKWDGKNKLHQAVHKCLHVLLCCCMSIYLWLQSCIPSLERQMLGVRGLKAFLCIKEPVVCRHTVGIFTGYTFDYLHLYLVNINNSKTYLLKNSGYSLCAALKRAQITNPDLIYLIMPFQRASGCHR